MHNRRYSRESRLVYGEGAHDSTFLKLLREYYVDRQKLHVEVKGSTGGDQVSVVRDAKNELGDYSIRTVVMDNDRDVNEMRKADALAKKNGIRIIRNNPCGDRTLLGILEPDKNTNAMKSQHIKGYLQEHYIPENKRTSLEEYRRKVPKKLIDKARKKSKILDEIVKLFEM